MKELILWSLLMVTGLICFCQPTSQALPTVQTDYLKKAKKQKTAAWLMLSGGVIVGAVGAYLVAYDAADGAPPGFNPNPIILVTGLAAIGGSVALFVASSKNKKKAAAMTAGIKIENSQLMRQTSLSKAQYPALSVKIGL